MCAVWYYIYALGVCFLLNLLFFFFLIGVGVWRHKRDRAGKVIKEGKRRTMGSKISYLNILCGTEWWFDRAVKPDFFLKPAQINKHIKEITEASAQPVSTTAPSWQEYIITTTSQFLSNALAMTQKEEFGMWLIAFHLKVRLQSDFSNKKVRDNWAQKKLRLDVLMRLIPPSIRCLTKH